MQRQELLKIAAFTILCTAIGGIIGGWIAAVIGAAIGLCIGILVKYPTVGFWVFLIYLPFAGTITHGIARGNEAFHLAKDLFYIPALIGALIQYRKQLKEFLKTIYPLLPPLLFLIGISIATFLWVNWLEQILTPTRGDQFLMGIMGLKVLLGYIPLIFCGYYLIRSQKELIFLTRLHLVLVLICCSLGFIQYLLLVANICPGNTVLTGVYQYRATLGARCFIGGALLYNQDVGSIRLPGTFVAPWQWGWFLISSSFLTFAVDVSDRDRRWRIASSVASGLVLVMAVISGQRTALVLVPLIFLLLQLLTDKNKKLLSLKWAIGLGLSLIIINNIDKVEQRVNSLVDRWNYSPVSRFMIEQFQRSIDQHKGLLGNGLGSATNAARYFAPTELIETFHAKLIYEIGPLGLLGFLAVVSVLSLLTFKAYRSIQDPNWRSLGICLWVYILLISYFPYYYPLDVDPVAVYYWFFAGVLLRLPQLDRQQTNNNSQQEAIGPGISGTNAEQPTPNN